MSECLNCGYVRQWAELPEASPWIAVSERLPPNDVDVLCWRKDGRPPVVAGQFRNGIGEGWYAFDSEIGIRHITHWMELPQPPLAALDSSTERSAK